MATQNTIGIGVVISDNGTAKKTIKNVEELHSTIKKTQTTAEKGVNLGGTAGSRKAVAAGSQPSSAVLAASAPTGSAELMQYGQMRGSAGATGASARDFANQAQGLGGLVRLYATYAANIFAVGAAFRALSSAMDTTNMVKGLDQLGASSGTALGSLSKQLVAATDGAVSLREAMETTAKASSSGMSSENILRMGKVAKQASQALGVDMSDAVSRISRGIVKLEPELLDEIGLFTKTGKAAEDYAKSVGKSASQLTDFERRAAFANAVLAEGEKKFGAIDLQTNPYTQLLASIKDLSQVGLELINKVLGPIVKFFSESPAALATAISGLAVVLVKQALPALGEFKAGLQAAADKATDISKRKAEDAAAARKQIDSIVIAELYDKEEEKIAIVDAAESKILKLRAEASSATRKLLNDDVNGKATIEEADAVERLSRKRLEAIDNGKVYKTITREQVEADIEAASAVRERIQVQKQITDTETQLAKNRERDAKGITTYGATVSAARKAETNATKAQIISNAAYNGSLIGTSDAMVLMREELKKSGLQMGKSEAATLSARARMSAFVGQVGTAMNALGVVGMVVGAAIGAFQLLNAAFSKNAKETGDFEKALDRGTSALENLGKTMDFINKKPLLDQVSVESINARTTAFKEVADSVSSMTTTLLKADSAASGWDRFMDRFATIWDGDLASKFSKNMSMTIFGSIEKMGSAPEAKEAREKIAEILQIDPTFTKNQLAEILEVTAKTAPEKLKKLETGLQAIGVAAQVSAAKSSELQSAFTKLGDLRKEIENKTMPTDDLTKYGLEMVNSFTKLSLALEDPKTKLNAIQQLSKELMYVPGAKLSEVMGLQQVAEDAQAAERALAKLDQNKRKIAENRAKLEGMTGKAAAAAAIDNGDLQRVRSLVNPKDYELVKDLVNEIKYLTDDSNTQINIRAELSGKIEAASGQIEAAQLAVFKEGSKFITQGLSAEWAKAGATITNAYASILAGTATGIKMRAAAEQASLTAQVNIIKSQQDLIISNRELALQIQEQTLAEKEREANRFGSPGAFKEERAQLEKARTGLAAARSGNVKGLYASLSKELESATGPMSQIRLDAIEFARKMEAGAAAVKNTEAQQGAIKIREQVELLQNAQNTTNKIAEEEIKGLGIKKQHLEVVKDILGETNSAYIIAKQNIDTQTLEKQQRLELQKIEDKIAQYRMVPNAGAKEEIAILEAEKNRLKALQAGSTEVLKQQQVQEVRTAKYREEQKLATEIFDEAQRQQELSREMLSIEETKFELLKGQGAIGENYAITYERILKLKQAEAVFDAGVLAAARERDTKLRDVEKNREGLAKFGTPEFADPVQAKARDRVQRDEAAINAAYQYRVGLLGTIRDASLQNADSIAAAAAEQLKWNEALAAAKGLTESLSTVFKELGSALGQTLETMVTFANTSAKNQEDTIAKQTTLNKVKANGRSTAEELDAAEKDWANQKKKNTSDELKGISSIAGNAKKMFKEKTAAHKALAAVEKVLHVQRIAMDLKEMVQKLFTDGAEVTSTIAAETAKTGATSAGFLARTGTYISEIFAKFTAAMGPWGWAAAAAVVAAIFGGGGKSKGSFVPSAEQRQETQGTAMGWDNQGNKVQTSRGVFGDTDAKSESIANSLERIKETSVDGLRYDNKMVDLLSKINEGINNTAKSLYSIRGLRQGTLFDTREGTTKGKGLLGSGLFGSKTSTNITDSGVLINATFADLASTTSQAAIQFYEDVTTTKKKWYGSSKTSYSRNLETADQITQDYFNDIFSNATELFKEIGQDAGMQVEQVLSSLSGVSFANLSVSLRGLKGEDLEKELNAVISSMLDQGAEAVFSQFMQFEEFGEGMLETVIRVTDNNRKVKQALSNLGIGTLRNVTGMASFEITEALVEAAGGIQDFLAKAEDYRENFLTEAERLAPIQLEVSAEIARIAKLGFTSADGLVDTRQEFKALVSSLDLTSETGRTAYTALMSVAEGFDQVTSAAEDATDKLKTTQQSILDQVLELTGTASEILAASRARTLSETPEELRALQNYVFALEDVKTAEAALTKAREAEVNKLKQQKSTTESTINSLNNYINSIKKFRESLLLGAQSPLTPAQRYAEAERQFDALLATANGPATTPAEIRTRDLALSQLEGAASAFLEASRIYNASSPQYTSDFSKVQGALSSTESSLTAQLSIEEKSLAELESQTSFLEAQIAATNGVNSSVLSVADAIAGLESALQTAAVTGGKAIIDNGILYGGQGISTTLSDAYTSIKDYVDNVASKASGDDQVRAVTDLYNNLVKNWGLSSQQLAQIMGSPQQDILSSFTEYGLPAFAAGTNFVPDDMIAQIHQGERIVPAADNAELMATIGNRNRTNEVLAQEIKKLNQEIKVLQKAVVDGAVINAQATDRNTVEISKTVKDTGLTASHTEAIRRRTQIV